MDRPKDNTGTGRGRLAVYALCDPRGEADAYVLFFLRSLREVAARVRVVVCGGLDETGLDKLRALADAVQTEAEITSETDAYAAAIQAEGPGTLGGWDEVILCSSALYGPFRPFREMFDAMADRDAGLWGVADAQVAGSARYLLPSFLVVRRRLAAQGWFQALWQGLSDVPADGKAAALTRAAEEHGCAWAAYCGGVLPDGYSPDPMLDFPRVLLEAGRSPVMDRRPFTRDYGVILDQGGGEAAREAFDFLRENTAYDTDMILAHLLRTENMADLKKHLHWNYVLPTDHLRKSAGPSRLKTALLLYIYYPDLAEECAAYAARMPEEMDLCVTVPDSGRLEAVKPFFAALEETRRIEYRLSGNRGRDLGPFLVTCADLIRKYDLVLKVHDKKVPQLQPLSIGQSWEHMCFECLMAGTDYIRNVISLFEDNPRLGILSPPPPLHSLYFIVTGSTEWGVNYQVTKALYDELKLRSPISEDREPVAPFGSEFWVRTDALRPIMDRGWTMDDFPKEPLAVDGTMMHGIERLFPFAAQDAGYYAGWVMPDSCAKIHFDNWRYTLGGLTAEEANVSGGWTSFREMTERIRKK